MAARVANKLTARAVETLSTPGRHADGAGLYLSIRTGGSRQWIFLFRQNGRLREMGLGGVSDIPLKTARAKAAEIRAQIAQGLDPIAARKQEDAKGATVPTFGAYAVALVDRIETGFSNPKHRQQWRNTLKTYAKPIWSMPVDQVHTAGVLSCLTPIWQTKAETASRVRQRIERVLSAAKAEGLRSGENPAAWRGHLDATLPQPAKLKRGHHAALPYNELPAFMEKLRARDGIGSMALEFCILTATRTKETIEARWTEFDLDAGLWVIPAERMKARVEHRVPLSARALVILRKLSEHRTGDFVFPGLKPGHSLSNMTMLKVLALMGLKGSVTSHGFRSAFSDWASEVSSFSAETRETALAHRIKDKAEAAYRRGDALEKRRAMMEAWAKWCEPKTEVNVVNLRRR